MKVTADFVSSVPPLPTVPVLSGRVTLTMDARDAAALLAITEKIGGEPEGPRGAFDRIRDALLRLPTGDAAWRKIAALSDRCAMAEALHLESKSLSFAYDKFWGDNVAGVNMSN